MPVGTRVLTGDNMKLICCICGKLLKGNSDDTIISHGMCKPCSKIYLAEQLAAADQLLKEKAVAGGPCR